MVWYGLMNSLKLIFPTGPVFGGDRSLAFSDTNFEIYDLNWLSSVRREIFVMDSMLSEGRNTR